MSSQAMAAGPAGRKSFAPWHKRDHDFFLLWVLLIWVGIVMGFGSDMIHHIEAQRPAYPLIVHFHAAVFVGFLVLLTTQVLLVRNKRTDIHRKLGVAGVALAAVMLVLGPATAIVVQRAQWGTPDSDPSFVAIQFIGILDFFVLIAAAAISRSNAPAHKRLIVLAVLAISDAGFARWLGGGLLHRFGDGFWGLWIAFFGASFTLVIGMGVYDLITRRRLHPAYVAGTIWIFSCQVVEDALYHSPAWKTVATHLIGH